MKKTFYAALTLVLLLSVAFTAYAAGGYMSLSASSATVYPGDTFSVSVWLTNSDPVSNGGVVLSFDSSALEIIGGSCQVSNAALAEVNAGNSGGVFVLQEDRVVSGSIFTIQMRVKSGAAAGAYTISGSGSLNGVGCSTGSASITVACKHNFTNPTNQNDSNHILTCSGCQQTKTEAHTWNTGTVTQEPTCAKAGTKQLTCTACGAQKESTVPATGNHKYGSWSKESDSKHVRQCEVCNKKDSASHNWTVSKVIKEATCAQTGTNQLTCSGCKAEKESTVPVTDNHKYGSWSKENDSSHVRQCQVCNKKDTGSHNWTVVKVTKEATCQETGSEDVKCSNCGYTKTRITELTSHNYRDWVKDDEQFHKRICRICQNEEKEKHSVGENWEHDGNAHFKTCICGEACEWAIHVPGPEPTETEDQICTVCERVLRPNTAHVHKYQRTWTYDELGHWHKCEHCDEKSGFAVHAYEDECADKCAVCSISRTAPHVPSTQLSSDETGHWYTCTQCDEKLSFAEHIPGKEATISTPQICTECVWEIAPILPHDHVYNEVGSTHTHTCACGQPYTADAKTCSVCLAEQDEPFPWWIVCIAEAVAFAAVIAVLFIISKKKNKSKD